jgi:hypothetical protein
MSNIERRFGRFGPGIVAAGRVAAGIVASTLASLALFVGPAAAQATWDDVIAAAK